MRQEETKMCVSWASAGCVRNQQGGQGSVCKWEVILLHAYASIGAGSLGLSDNTVKNIARKVRVTEAQVLLRWSLLPKSAKEEGRKTKRGIWGSS